MENLKEKIKNALVSAMSSTPSPSIDELNIVADELVESFYTEYDPLKAIQEMLRDDSEVYSMWQQGIAMNFKNLVIYNQVLEDVPIIVFDESQVDRLSNLAAKNFLDLFSEKPVEEKFAETE